jgi:hypothetical protein
MMVSRYFVSCGVALHISIYQSVIMNERGPVTCRNAIVIDPQWRLDDLVKAYANICYDGEHPETVTLLNTPAPEFRHFVIAAELGLKCLEGEHEGDIDVAIAAVQHGDWLTKADVTRTLDWLGARANERDLHMVYNINSVGPHARVLNSDQFVSQQTISAASSAIPASLGPAAETEAGVFQASAIDSTEHPQQQSEGGPTTKDAGPPVVRSSLNAPIPLDSDDDDEPENGNFAQETTPPRKRSCSDDSLVMESPSKKAKVKEEEDGEERKDTEDVNPRVAAEAVTADGPSTMPASPQLPTPLAHRRRWTAHQQFAMISTLYAVGYEQGDWESIAARVNATNPQGQPKSKTRVKSAMRETHWSKFLQANNDGNFGHDQLVISFPDMSGPPTSTGAAWTTQQKQAVWFETFAFAERNVK